MEHLSYLKRVNNANAIITAVLGLAAVIGLGVMTYQTYQFGDPVTGLILVATTVFSLVMVAVSIVLYVITGKKVEQGRWRIMQTVLAVLNLGSNPPLGTAYGIYALYVCWFNDAAKSCFEAGHGAIGEVEPSPKATRFYKIVMGIMIVSGVLFTLLTIGVFIAVVYLFSWGALEPEVTVTDQQIKIESMYGEVIQRSEISEIELRDELPTITLRTNGYALGGTLKGWFQTREMGKVKLFVHADSPPFLYLHTTDHWVILGYDDPARTRALYEQIRGPATPPAPGG